MRLAHKEHEQAHAHNRTSVRKWRMSELSRRMGLSAKSSSVGNGAPLQKTNTQRSITCLRASYSPMASSV